MSHTSFALKYRPQNFDDIVGQEHIARILKNAIKLEKTAHAYLFTGPRGVGKTSTARIFSKALNCHKGPTAEPCQKCPSCLEITQSRSLDTIEIDGASNNGVEEVRNLRENVQFAPAGGKYKIYIIDEVHMLSQAAFNALLKTLEEPPRHVKFIFATTHPEKILKTIISRCQQYDFKRLSVETIVKALQNIAKDEKIKADDNALMLIARAGDGSMRDALVLFDQVNAIGEDKITAEMVTQALGLVGDDMLFEATDIIRTNDSAGAFAFIENVVHGGGDLELFIDSLIEHVRNILVVQTAEKHTHLISKPKLYIDKIKDYADHFSKEELIYLYELLMETKDRARSTQGPRIPLEMFFARAARKHPLMNVEDIFARLETVKKKLDNAPAAVISKSESPPAPKKADSALPDTPPKQEVKPKTNALSSFAKRAAGLTNLTKGGAFEKSEKTEQHAGEETAAPAIADTATLEPPSFSEKKTLELSYVKKAWPVVITHLRNKKISIASYLLEGEVEAIEENAIIVSFAKDFAFHKEALEHTENRRLVEATMREVLKTEAIVKFTLSEKAADQQKNPASFDESADQEASAENTEGATRPDPIVESAIDVFNGHVVDFER